MNVLVVGASEKSYRYANKAIHLLLAKGHKVFALAKRNGQVESVVFKTNIDEFNNKQIDTVTLYVGPTHQGELMQNIIDLNVRRVIFNPGTENLFFEEQLKQNGVEVVIACTLVMLNTNQF